MIQFEVLGEPKALKRHRMGKGFNFDPSKGDKTDFLWMSKKNAPSKPIDSPIKVSITFRFKRPKSHFGIGKNSNLLKDSAPTYHTSRPDADNLAKFVLDALNTVYWRDDSIISKLNVTKVYALDTPRTEVEIVLIS